MNKIRQTFFLYKNTFIWGFILIVIAIMSFLGIYYFGVLNMESEIIETEVSTISDLEISNNSSDTPTSIEKEEQIKQEVNNLIKVDVKGQVKKPGVYEVESDYRVVDVIKKAGGLAKDADTSVTNLSKKVYDEMVIIIYSDKEVKNYTTVKKVEKENKEFCLNTQEGINDSCVNDSSIKEDKNMSESKISINTDNIEELMKLSGIGESKAKQIITYRKENGNFTKIEDLLNVEGIGESIFEKIKDNITT